MEDNDAQLQLKKRARRRLVGAIAFASVVAIVLPAIMDNEPRQPVQDVEIRIPGQDEKPFAPRFAAPAERPAEKPAARAETPPAPATTPLPTPEARPASRPEVPPVTEARPEAKPLGAPTARVVEVVRDKGDKTEKNDKTSKPVDKAPEKPAAKPEKPAEKPAAKPEKPADKPADKEKDKEKEKAKNEEAKRAAALLGGQAAESKPAAKGGEFVILIGAFANEDNVRNLRSKLGEQGVKSYTEPLDSPQGRKTRLRAGPFPNREAADKALDKMRRIGVSGVVAAKQ